MPRTLLIQGLPDALADRLDRRAQVHGRTPHDELLAILEESLMPKPVSALDALRRAREIGLHTADEATIMVREDRDARQGPHASALAAVLFNEPKADLVARHLVDSKLLAPALLPFELMSICLKKLRRYPDEREKILSQWALFEKMSIEIEPVDSDQIISLAESSDLTTYDASYLWLAQAREASLVTIDKTLHRVARQFLSPRRSLPDAH